MSILGQLWATSELEMAIQSAQQGFRVIYLGDYMSLDPMYKDAFIVATSLVPDYQTLACKVDGDEKSFVGMYLASLNSKAAMEMMSAILACLYKGTSIMFYIPKEALSLGYISNLLEYIRLNWGIQTQTKSTQFSFDITFMPRIMELLYLNNLATAQEFLIHSETLNELTLRKLVDDLHPMVKDPRNLDQIIAWFSNYKDKLIAAQAPLINGIQYAGEVSDYGCY